MKIVIKKKLIIMNLLENLLITKKMIMFLKNLKENFMQEIFYLS